MSGLARFVVAQDGVYATALAEIRDGRKVSHWMWFIFPQLASLGRSATAKRFGIADLAEARAYLAHPLLGDRLDRISRAMLVHRGMAPDKVLGTVDALKLRSCATLFDAAADGQGPYGEILSAFYGGKRCPLTLDALGLS